MNRSRITHQIPLFTSRPSLNTRTGKIRRRKPAVISSTSNKKNDKFATLSSNSRNNRLRISFLFDILGLAIRLSPITTRKHLGHYQHHIRNSPIVSGSSLKGSSTSLTFFSKFKFRPSALTSCLDFR